MNKATADKLHQLNHEFYRLKAQQFNQTRHYQWQGWQTLFDYFKHINQPCQTILDLGCGNGRFAQAATTLAGTAFDYLGIDSSSELIALAKQHNSAPNLTFRHAEIITFLDSNLSSNTRHFDLIVLFGVMHHIPGQENRITLLNKLKQTLSPGGKIVLTVWNFEQLKLFERRLNPTQITQLGIDPQLLENDDYLLSWNNAQDAFRYCHLHSAEEVEKIANIAGLKIAKSFGADGKNGKTNTYYVLSNLLLD